MVNPALPEGIRSVGGSSYVHDVLQGRCAGIGVEDARIPGVCGNENTLVEAVK